VRQDEGVSPQRKWHDRAHASLCLVAAHQRRTDEMADVPDALWAQAIGVGAQP
jgi:hypothetical protein